MGKRKRKPIWVLIRNVGYCTDVLRAYTSNEEAWKDARERGKEYSVEPIRLYKKVEW